MLKARVAHFYGWTDDYIMDLEYDTVMEYYKAITIIDASDRLVDLTVADYPNSKNKSRQKIHKNMYKLANPKHLRKEISFEDFQEKISGRRKN